MEAQSDTSGVRSQWETPTGRLVAARTAGSQITGALRRQPAPLTPRTFYQTKSSI